MTPEQQRIAIAEACGWYRNGTKCNGRFPAYSHPEKDCRCTVHQLPNYPGDLNDMHEAEKVLLKDADFGYKYDCELNIVVEAFEDGCVNYMKLWHATAAQRAEAFLRAIGKWTD